MQNIVDTIVGFVPRFHIFWTGVALFVIIIVAHYIYRWLHQVTQLPWMTEENQRNRDKLIQEMRKK